MVSAAVTSGRQRFHLYARFMVAARSGHDPDTVRQQRPRSTSRWSAVQGKAGSVRAFLAAMMPAILAAAKTSPFAVAQEQIQGLLFHDHLCFTRRRSFCFSLSANMHHARLPRLLICVSSIVNDLPRHFEHISAHICKAACEFIHKHFLNFCTAGKPKADRKTIKS